MTSSTASDLLATEQQAIEEFDLVIIGAGSGNSIPSPELSHLKIAIVDDGRWFGGTCLNAGCIPTKMFVRPADLARNLREAGRLGVSVQNVELDWDAVRERVFGRIDPISAGGEQYRASGEPNISLVRETVRFSGTHELTTSSGRVLRASQIVIGAGSRPRALDVLPFGDTVFSSDHAMRLESLPERVAVVGGGVVAAEFAAMYSGFGAAVTQLNRSALFRGFDHDIADTFTTVGSRNWDIRTDVEIVAATKNDAGWTLSLSDATTLEVDAVLVAAGRIPNTDRLGTPEAGFDHEDDGRLTVDEYQRVLQDGKPVGGLFALGDISSSHQLKHVANHDARVVARNLLAEQRTHASAADRNVDARIAEDWSPEHRDDRLTKNTLGPVPYTVFSAPEIAVFGMTLAEAKDAGLDAIEVRQDFGGTAWGWALEDRDSFCKIVVVRGSGKILGAHIIGPDAPILLQPLLQAASFGQSVSGLARGQYWPHPAATEIIENALLQAEEEIQK